MINDERLTKINRARAILDMGAMRLQHASGVYCVVMKQGRGLAIATAGTAVILGMPYDLLSMEEPFQPGEYRNDPHVFYAMSNGRPDDDKLRDIVLRTMTHAPLSLLVLATDGEVEEIADVMRSAHEECVVSTCHF